MAILNYGCKVKLMMWIYIYIYRADIYRIVYDNIYTKRRRNIYISRRLLDIGRAEVTEWSMKSSGL
jgi:hypothetical protein